MTEERKKRYARYAVLPVSLLVLSGLYFGAQAAADVRFASVVESASDIQVQTKDGLWNYNVLTPREQQLYEVLLDAMAARETDTARVSFVPTQTEFSAAFEAVLCDYPLFCDLVREECVLLAADHSAYAVLAYHPDEGSRREALELAVNGMLAELSLSDPQAAALQIHDMLTAHCTYPPLSDDLQIEVGDTAYDALVIGYADSFGYARAYALLCRSAGIDCTVVQGTVDTTDSTGGHAWNVLTLDGMTGFTDVMWDDTAELADAAEGAAVIPFHGYYFLSAEEMEADHTPLYDFGVRGDTSDYYEQSDLCVYSAETLAPLLTSLLTDARRTQSPTVEFWLDPSLRMTGYALEEVLTQAITAANTDELSETPLLRPVHRIYHTSSGGGGITVQLFYEESDGLGETQ